jgi:muramoyltetrapeptide carboxypeptidase LdcA involved in peptidoglycan recycling
MKCIIGLSDIDKIHNKFYSENIINKYGNKSTADSDKKSWRVLF